MDTAADILGLWPSATALAEELGVSVITVRSWKQRNSIPPAHWRGLCKSARAHGIQGVTLGTLARLAERASKAPPPTGLPSAEGRAA